MVASFISRLYRIGKNFRGMKFSRISWIILALQTYNHEHFMHHQLIVILVVVFGIGSKMSGILRFFKPLKESELTPKLRELASKEVKKCKERTATLGMKRGRYDFFSPENKAKVAKYALENDVTASLHHFKQTGEFNNLKESTVRGCVKQYRSELRPAASESSTESRNYAKRNEEGLCLLARI